jgi:hypothetical protein
MGSVGHESVTDAPIPWSEPPGRHVSDDLDRDDVPPAPVTVNGGTSDGYVASDSAAVTD